MPSAEEFAAAAVLFDEAAEQSRTTGARPEAKFGPHVLRGGKLTFQVDDVVGRGRADTGASAQQLASLANEARRRAGIAETAAAEWKAYESKYKAYEKQYNEYRAGRRGAPVAPRAPGVPPKWVDLSGTVRTFKEPAKPSYAPYVAPAAATALAVSGIGFFGTTSRPSTTKQATSSALRRPSTSGTSRVLPRTSITMGYAGRSVGSSAYGSSVYSGRFGSVAGSKSNYVAPRATPQTMSRPAVKSTPLRIVGTPVRSFQSTGSRLASPMSFTSTGSRLAGPMSFTSTGSRLAGPMSFQSTGSQLAGPVRSFQSTPLRIVSSPPTTRYSYSSWGGSSLSGSWLSASPPKAPTVRSSFSSLFSSSRYR